MNTRSLLVILLLAIFVMITSSSAMAFQAERRARERPVSRVGVLRLESDLNKIDIASRRDEVDVEVNVQGHNESDGMMNIRVLSQPQSSTGGGARTAENRTGVGEGANDLLTPQTISINLSVLDIPDTLITQTIVSIFTKENAVGELAGVKVRQVGASANYEVVEDYTYQYGAYKITVPKGFVYDRASIPRIFWVLVDKDSLSNVAPLFHDFLYRNGGRPPQNLVLPYRTFTREDTDNLFFELMTKCGVDNWRRKAAYEAVRNFSGFAWRQ